MLKGRTTIELTDVKTNKKEVYESENMVTNAVPDIFKYNPSCLMYPVQYSSDSIFYKVMFPVSTKCYGGLLLFEEALKEDVDNYYAPSNNKVIGYAAQSVNDTENPLRGSINLQETKQLDNGYKFVWDFATSQANGKISALSLSHEDAGYAYYGHMYGNYRDVASINETGIIMEDNFMRIYLGMVEAFPKENYFISIWPAQNKTLEIIKFKESFTSLGLNDTIKNFTNQKIEKTVLDMKDFYKNANSWNESCFFDGEDGFYYGLVNASGDYDNSSRINKIKISKKDYSFTVNTFVLENIQVKAFGAYPSFDNNMPKRTDNMVYRNGYVYTITKSGDKLVKFNLNNPVDVKLIDLGFKEEYNYRGNYRLYKLNDFIIGNRFSVDRDDVVRVKQNRTLYLVNTPFIKFGSLLLGYGSYYDSGRYLYKVLFINTKYLGTINNLSTPILKTADKTMKITYTLTEEEGNE